MATLSGLTGCKQHDQDQAYEIPEFLVQANNSSVGARNMYSFALNVKFTRIRV